MYIGKRERYKILKKQNWKCAICGKSLKFSRWHKYGKEVAHIDHKHPRSKKNSYNGFIDEKKNLQALCATCNLKKHDNKYAHLELDFWKNRKH